MSKHLQGILSSVTKISNEIKSAAFADFNDVSTITNLFSEYKEKVNIFQKEFDKEMNEENDDDELEQNQNWFDVKMSDIQEFINNTDNWLTSRTKYNTNTQSNVLINQENSSENKMLVKQVRAHKL